MKKSIVVILLVSLSSVIIAQSYNTVVGLRLGKEYGMTINQRIFKDFTVEGIFHSNFRTKSEISVLAEFHKKIIFRGFNFYMGLGMHKGWDKTLNTEETDLKNPMGVSGIAGLELTIAKFNITFDFKPGLNVVGGADFFDSSTALSVRYVIGSKRPKGKSGNGFGFGKGKSTKKKSSKKPGIFGKK